MPFAGSKHNFFTNDGGQTFQRAVYDADYGCLKIILNGLENDSEALDTLKESFEIWHKASGHSDRRAKVRDTCARLMELLTSVSQTCQTLPHLRVVRSISEMSQTATDGEFQQVEDSLGTLLRHLSATDAGDGQGIINPSRFEQFLNERD